jgi:purine nucleosidase
LGATAVHGNTNHDQVLRNAGAILRFLNQDGKIPYFGGCKSPLNQPILDGDGAHGDDGVAGVTLIDSDFPPESVEACDFILNILRENPTDTITITATGPLSNIAKAYLKEPETMRKVKEIVVMGGCTTEMPAYDLSVRQGNITPYGEFNFYMAAQDADTVMQSGLPVTLFPMNCSYQLDFTPARQAQLRQALAQVDSEIVQNIVDLIKAPESMDQEKFNIYGTMNDVHTALYLLDKESLYKGRAGRVSVVHDGEQQGLSHFTPDSKGSIFVMESPVSADRLFDLVVESFVKVFS